MKNSSEILGGYNPIKWQPCYPYSYSNTKDSFIFSFKNNNNIVLSHVKNEKNAIYNDPEYGPSFGDDLYLYEGIEGDIGFMVSVRKVHYEELIKETNSTSSVEEF